MKYIKLNLVVNDVLQIYININKIKTFYRSGKGTRIEYVIGDSENVTQTPEYIIKQIELLCGSVK